MAISPREGGTGPQYLGYGSNLSMPTYIMVGKISKSELRPSIPFIRLFFMNFLLFFF